MQRKLALVIGNRDYAQSPLQNPVNDANDMTNSLKSIGFQVTKGLNMKYEQMHSHLDHFVHRIQPSDLVLFYYSGHGMQWEDQNYLIPCGDENLQNTNIKYRAISAQDVLNQISKRKPYAAIFILDCCRNYYFPNQALMRGEDAGGKGLREMSAAGSLIAFACEPGSTARDGTGSNGLYTKHLLRYITQPNEQIQDILADIHRGVAAESADKQIPWYGSSLRDRNVMLARTDDGKPSKVNNEGKMKPYRPPICPSDEEEEKEPSGSQMIHLNQRHNASTRNDGRTRYEIHVVSSTWDSNNGGQRREFHGQLHGGNMDSMIREAEEFWDEDLDGDGRIG